MKKSEDMMPLGQRPRDWFGLEDWDGDEESDPTEEINKREEQQKEWDARYASLTTWQTLMFNLGFEVRAPVILSSREGDMHWSTTVQKNKL